MKHDSNVMIIGLTSRCALFLLQVISLRHDKIALLQISKAFLQGSNAQRRKNIESSLQKGDQNTSEVL